MDKLAEFINSLNNVVNAFLHSSFVVKIVLGGVLLGLLGGGTLWGCNNASTSEHAPIEYQIRVTNINSGKAISNVQIVLFSKDGPLYGKTDDSGLAQLIISPNLDTTSARLVVEAPNYQKKEIIITLMAMELPFPVQLVEN